jgi:hypothetical protein
MNERCTDAHGRSSDTRSTRTKRGFVRATLGGCASTGTWIVDSGWMGGDRDGAVVQGFQPCGSFGSVTRGGAALAPGYCLSALRAEDGRQEGRSVAPFRGFDGRWGSGPRAGALGYSLSARRACGGLGACVVPSSSDHREPAPCHAMGRAPWPGNG